MDEKIKALVVEDNKAVRDMLKNVLEKEGFLVRVSEDGINAFEMLTHEKFHLVVTDLQMPRMDGEELLSKIKKMDQTIEVILISGQSDMDVAVELMKKGAFDYVTKPIDLKKFLITVRQCAKKSLLSTENLELRERLALFEVSKAITTLDLRSLLKLIIESIQKVIPSDQGSIMLHDKKRNILIMEASFGLPKDLKKKFDFSKSPSKKVFELGKPVILIGGLEKDPAFHESSRHENMKSSMIFPLKIKNITIGIINLTRTKIHSEFSQRDLSLLTIFATHAVSAIENARLYKKLKDYSLIIKEEKKEMEAIVENISDGIIVCETPCKIVLANPSARELFHLNSTSVVGKCCADVFQHGGFSFIADLLHRFCELSSDFLEEKLNLNLDGENIHLRMTVVRVKASNYKRELKILAFEDLTRMVQSQKSEAWQDVARSLAHEVKNPLSPILWATEAIMEISTDHSKRSEETIQKKCDTIMREVKRIQSIISDFASFAKLPEPDLKATSIGPVFQELLSLYSSHPGINISTDIQADLPRIKMDVKMIKQVFINLIQNAIEAMSGGGDLTISSRVNSGEILISIKDTGPGIPEKTLEHLFDPYFTTKKTGTGLGLTISSKIISDHHGQLRVRSKENQGTTFTIHLPVA